MQIPSLQDKSMWTEEHWNLFDSMLNAYRNYFQGDEFGSNYSEFKKHMLYILQVMDVQFGVKDDTVSE